MNEKRHYYPHLLSEEELLKYINESTDQTVVVQDDELLRFIATFNMTIGDNPVAKKQIYTLYKQWSADPVSIRKFMIETTTKYFTKHDDKYFYLTVSPIEIQKLILSKKKEASRPFLKRSVVRHIENFVKFYNLQPGQHPVSFRGLYQLYDKYYYEQSTKKVQITEGLFRSIMNLTFKHKKTRSGTYYLLSVTEAQIRETRQKTKEEQQAF